jgi:hypothetical protein
MRALVPTGAGKKIGGENRHNEPSKDHQLDCARRTASKQINWKRGQRDDAAKQPWRDECPMTRRRQRILLRRRVDQRFNIISQRREQAHVPNARPASQTRSPFSMVDRVRRRLSER